MACSQRVRAQDHRQIAELIDRVCQVGNDPDAWRLEALVGLTGLLDGQVALAADMTHALPGVMPRLVRPVETGWFTEAHRQRFYDYCNSGEVTEDPGNFALVQAHRSVRFLTRMRREMVSDRDWYLAPAVAEARRTAQLDDYLCSTIALRPGVLQGFVVYRPWNERAFEQREQRILRLFHAQVLRLIGEGLRQQDQAPQTAPLPPRLRQTLDLLLAGCSTKEVATRLEISFHTANGYQRALHRRFNVHSRAELLARHLTQSHRRPALVLPHKLEPN